MAKCKRCEEGVPHRFKHGPSGYSNHGCRCSRCTKGWREYQRAWRERNAESLKVYKAKYHASKPKCQQCHDGVEHEFEHGLSSYTRHGCRCETCSAASRRYHQEYYQNNRQAVLDRVKTYRDTNKERISEYAAQYRASNKDGIMEKSRQYRSRNADKIAERRANRDPQTTRKWARNHYERHRDEILAQQRVYYSRNRDKVLAQAKEYRTRNAKYVTAASAAINKRIRTSTRSAASNARKPWSPDDLKVIARPDLKLEEMAYILGRSYDSVLIMRRKVRKASK